MMQLNLGDNVITKKSHACGCNRWVVLRTGADYKMQCTRCQHVVTISSQKFYKAVKDVIKSTNPN